MIDIPSHAEVLSRNLADMIVDDRPDEVSAEAKADLAKRLKETIEDWQRDNPEEIEGLDEDELELDELEDPDEEPK